MKKYFTTVNGREGVLIDCGSYIVEIFKSIDKDYYDSQIKFISKQDKKERIISSAFNIDFDIEADGGKIEIAYKDAWGCEMKFVHYEPGDLKGMFDFIGKGYNVFDGGFYFDSELIVK